jgi:hypothetical protein
MIDQQLAPLRRLMAEHERLTSDRHLLAVDAAAHARPLSPVEQMTRRYRDGDWRVEDADSYPTATEVEALHEVRR